MRFCSAQVLVAACWIVACSSEPPASHQPGAGGNLATAGATSGGAGSGGVATAGGGSGNGAGQATGGALPQAGAAGATSGGAGNAGSGGAATAGAGGQTGGTGGAPDTAAPTATPNGYRFAFGDVAFEVDAKVGGRVSKLALGGVDLVVASGTDPTTWGSVFWTSPRADWTPETWPPPAAIDNAAYTASLAGTHVVVTGTQDPGLGVKMTKDYSVDPATGWITLAYKIDASKSMKAAPWEVSRVPRGGIVFFPVGSSVTPGPLTLTQNAGIAWFDDAPQTAKSPEGDKCAADGKGWTAYVLGGNVFIKKFMDQPASAQAPGEGEVDVYPGAGFLEFEVQGPYTSIAAGSSLSWSIQWRVAKVPSSVNVTVGSATLVEFVEQQLAL